MLFLTLLSIFLIAKSYCSVATQEQPDEVFMQLRSNNQFEDFKNNAVTKISQFDELDTDQVKSIIEGNIPAEYSVRYVTLAGNPRMVVENLHTNDEFEIIYDKEQGAIEMSGDALNISFTMTYDLKDPNSAVFIFTKDDEEKTIAHIETDASGNQIVFRGAFAENSEETEDDTTADTDLDDAE